MTGVRRNIRGDMLGSRYAVTGVAVLDGVRASALIVGTENG
jgi:hypothetical protein